VSTTAAESAWPAIAPEREIAHREDLTRLGLWMFLATVAMLFAAFTSAYVVRRSGGDWRMVALPWTLWLNTAVLVASSAALEAAKWFGSRSAWRRSGVAFALAIALGLAFLGGQVLAWRELMAAGVYLPSNPYSSFFFMMTGAHAVHVVAALSVLIRGGVQTWRGTGRRHPRGWAASIDVCRTFWHFLLGVWVYVFLLVTTY
jgi:cytochrome c oxidase subunit 3